jgi:hypothetical protein
MSQPVAFSPNAFRLICAGHDESTRPSHHAASTAIAAVSRVSFPNPFPTSLPTSAKPESTVSGPPESRGDELLGHADRIGMDAAGPVTAAYVGCSDGSAAIV